MATPERPGHEDHRQSDGRRLSDGAYAGAAHDEVRPGHEGRRVGDESQPCVATAGMLGDAGGALVTGDVDDLFEDRAQVVEA